MSMFGTTSHTDSL